MPRELRVHLPSWIETVADPARGYLTDAAKMELVTALARENVLRRTGGPFGAAVFRRDSGTLAGIGVNLVTSLNNSVLHAEVLALMFAQAEVGSYTLGAPGLPAFELVTSCEPCAMCLGAVFWSGVKRMVTGATREDAEAFGFDEGPVFAESYAYLSRRGIEVVREVGREAAAEVIRRYAEQGGAAYNA